MSEQLQFPFPSLDFPGRVTLYTWEIAQRLGVTDQHIKDLIEEAALPALNIAGKHNKSKRRLLRIPVEAYRDWIIASLTSPYERMRLLSRLPNATLRGLVRDINAYLKAA